MDQTEDSGGSQSASASPCSRSRVLDGPQRRDVFLPVLTQRSLKNIEPALKERSAAIWLRNGVLVFRPSAQFRIFYTE